jgi:diguanylate cyclase (GGDEF)-like protein/PAS domain S-box-containing protein
MRADIQNSEADRRRRVHDRRAEEPARQSDPQGAERIARLFEMTSDLLATISEDGRFTLLNPAWEQVLGWTATELEARSVGELIHPDDMERTSTLLFNGSEGVSELEDFTNRYRHRDGSWRWLLWSARRDGDTWYAAAKDVTDRMWLERQALKDSLTGLPNRLLLMDRTRQALARLHRSGGIIALLFIDLDRFKAVNDSLGHEIGDHLLVAIAERLSQVMRDGDTVARLGGDEFVVLAEGIESDGEAVAVAERVLHALEKPFQIGSAEVSMLASVGVSVARDPDLDPESILREADVAMYRAKATGGRALEVFDERLRHELRAHLELESRLRDALPRHELILAYQPIMPLGGGPPIGCEALVRWHPHGEEPAKPGALLPQAFLPRAEDSELIVQIGEWVLHTACAQAAAWHRGGIKIPVSVNVSARELIELDLAERVREELAYSGLPGRALCLEVSEEAILRDPDRARAALRDLKRLGVMLALDNFGSGPSSLSLPGSLPLDIVKLDRGLIQDFERDRATRSMVRAVVALTQDSDLTAVAVGIETSSQLALAQKLEYAVGQGFLLRQPDAPERLHLRDHHGTVTSAPWQPIVRIRGQSHHR